MKKIFFFSLICLMALTVNAQWVDLGLPSGTLWKNSNEDGGYYTYEQAVNKFGSSLPAKEQWEELQNKCRWTWTGSGYKVVGPNGQSINLPAVGYHNYFEDNVYEVGSEGLYWTSTPDGSDNANACRFSNDNIFVFPGYRYHGFSVRLVQRGDVIKPRR